MDPAPIFIRITATQDRLGVAPRPHGDPPRASPIVLSRRKNNSPTGALRASVGSTEAMWSEASYHRDASSHDAAAKFLAGLRSGDHSGNRYLAARCEHGVIRIWQLLPEG